MTIARQPDSPLIERTGPGLHASLASFIQTLPGLDLQRPVLDIGCGTGAWLDRLSNIGFKCLYGLDQDVQQFATKKAHCLQVNLDSENYGLEDHSFGLITSIEVIEHLENPGYFFSFVSSHLDKDGYFLLTTPNIHSVLSRFRFLITGNLKQFDSIGDPTHIYPVLLILLSSLNRILPRYGLSIEKQWWYPEKGSITSRTSLKRASFFLEKLLPEEVPGDVLCLLIQKIK